LPGGKLKEISLKAKDPIPNARQCMCKEKLIIGLNPMLNSNDFNDMPELTKVLILHLSSEIKPVFMSYGLNEIDASILVGRLIDDIRQSNRIKESFSKGMPSYVSLEYSGGTQSWGLNYSFTRDDVLKQLDKELPVIGLTAFLYKANQVYNQAQPIAKGNIH
jgi:hypothetical protein